MKPAIINGKCRLIGHCATCRSDPAWRSSTGAPTECPHGITSETLPSLLTSKHRMNVIRDTSTVPGTGWQYPGIGGYMVHTHNYSLLYSLVCEHYQANGAPVPSPQDVVDYCCANLYIPCIDSESRAPLANSFTMGLPPKQKGCCGSK